MNNQPQPIPAIPATKREAIYWLAHTLIAIGLTMGLFDEVMAGLITAAVGALINAITVFLHRPTKLGQP